jgi:ADP-ribose pyrophosphatase YjhB (NUDIX family)
VGGDDDGAPQRAGRHGVVERVEWARRLQAIAQSGLAYDPHVYDRERYEEVRRVAAEMLAAADGRDAERAERILSLETGHATPKMDVRGVVFRDGGILLVRERVGGGWSLPGGWADVGETPAESVAREVREESGWDVRPVRLLGLYDRDRWGLPPHAWCVWKAFFLCDLAGGERAELGHETTDSAFFERDALPQPLRFGDATARQIGRCFEHLDHPEWPADFD